MKTMAVLILRFLLLLLCTKFAYAQEADCVKGYYRNDGTHVTGYYKTNSKDNSFDNWRISGNYNPYTAIGGTAGIVCGDRVVQ